MLIGLRMRDLMEKYHLSSSSTLRIGRIRSWELFRKLMKSRWMGMNKKETDLE
jgi:hypothetical protein